MTVRERRSLAVFGLPVRLGATAGWGCTTGGCGWGAVAGVGLGVVVVRNAMERRSELAHEQPPRLVKQRPSNVSFGDAVGPFGQA